MVTKQTPGPRTLVAGRKMKRMYSKQFGLLCDSCERDSFGKRTRCKECNSLLCSTCYVVGHVCVDEEKV